MKNLIIITCLVMAIFCFFSCSKKSDSAPVTKAAIEGKWTEDSATFVVYKNSVIVNTQKESTPDGSWRQFDADGKGLDYQPATQTTIGAFPAVTVNITYTLAQSKLNINYPNYTANTGIQYMPYTDIWNVLTLNDHRLAIKYSEAENGGENPGDDIVQYFYFSK